MDSNSSIIVIILLLLVPTLWLYGMYKTYRNKGLFALLVVLSILLLLWRMYDNYSVGGLLIPLNSDEFSEWFSNDMHWSEVILWIIIFFTPFRMVFAEKCSRCGSTDVDEIDRELIAERTKSKMIGDEKQYYNVSTYDVKLQCNECGKTWKRRETEEEAI